MWHPSFAPKVAVVVVVLAVTSGGALVGEASVVLGLVFRYMGHCLLDRRSVTSGLVLCRFGWWIGGLMPFRHALSFFTAQLT